MKYDRKTFDRVFNSAIRRIKKKAPVDTGNLKENAIIGKWVSPTRYVIYINVGDTDAFVRGSANVRGVAPYTPFTNEKWVSPRWNGKQNPNEHWWNNACENTIEAIAKSLKGTLTRGK